MIRVSAFGRWGSPASRCRSRHEQHVRGDSQGICDLAQDDHRGIADTTFHAADVCAVEPTVKGKLFLRETLFPPQAPQVKADLLPNVHVGKQGGVMTIVLQPMSLISLAWMPRFTESPAMGLQRPDDEF
jgi:hypothetical protein